VPCLRRPVSLKARRGGSEASASRRQAKRRTFAFAECFGEQVGVQARKHQISQKECTPTLVELEKPGRNKTLCKALWRHFVSLVFWWQKSAEQ
jgi:hypothetical protein